MKKSCLSVIIVLLLSSFLFPQGMSSIQFSGGLVEPMSSNPGLSGVIQYNYNLTSRFNLFVSTDYSYWGQKYNNYYYDALSYNQHKIVYPESDHSLSRAMAGARYVVVEPAKFRLFVEGGIGYSYLKYKSYNINLVTNPDGTAELLYSNGAYESENLFNISTGIGFIHKMTSRWDILFEFKLNTYLNSHYYGIFSARGTFTEYFAGFNYRI